MGWFSPVKGSYPSLAQVDKTLPVAEGVKTIQRGSIVALGSDTDGKPVWKLPAGNNTDKLLYVALQDYTDPTAGFAGTAFDPNGGVPAITGIDLAQDGEYETSVFDGNATYAIGDPLKAGADGVLTKGVAGTDFIVGYVTAVPTDRWINNAIAVPKNGTDQRLAIRTGATKTVIRFKTAV